MSELSRACSVLHASRSEEEVLAAVREVEVAARCCSDGGGGGESVASGVLGAAKFVAALRGGHGAEACEAAMSAVTALLLAVARAPVWPAEGPGIDDGAGFDNLSLWALRDCAQHSVDATAAQAAWAAAEPLVMAHLEAGRWSLRYHAARCVLTQDVLLSLGDPPPAAECLARTQRLMRVARMSQDSRASLRGLALHAVVAALLLWWRTEDRRDGEHDKAKPFLCAAVWVHLVQLVDDADGRVARTARRLLSCSGYSTGDDPSTLHGAADVARCAAGPSATQKMQSGTRSQEAAASFLASVEVRHVLPILTCSLGLSSSWGRCATTIGEAHKDEEVSGKGGEELAWLRREVERQDVCARLAGINAILVIQRRHATAVQLEWGVQQEMRLLTALQRAPGIMHHSFPPSPTRVCLQTRCPHSCPAR